MQKVINSKFLQYLPFIFLLGPFFLEIYFFLLFILNIRNVNFRLTNHNIILVFFFLSILISSLLTEHNVSTFKGISYLRFLIYLIILETVIKLDKSSLEKFCKSALTVISILIIYNLYQIITEHNLDDHRTTLPIRLEPIAGSFITYFSAYIIPYIIWNFTSRDKNIYVTSITILIITIACIMSGERISSIVLISMIVILTILKSKKLFLIILISMISITVFINQFDNSRIKYIEKRIYSFSQDVKNFENSIWYHHFYAAKKSWEENKIFGNGVRSFRIECNKYRDIKKNACSSHPHNIYLELLSEVGLIGFFSFIILIINLIYKSLFVIVLNFNNKSIEFYLLLGLFSYLTVNYFPIKSFGSFFNNFNSFGFWTIFYFISTISIKFKKKQDNKLNKLN